MRKTKQINIRSKRLSKHLNPGKSDLCKSNLGKSNIFRIHKKGSESFKALHWIFFVIPTITIFFLMVVAITGSLKSSTTSSHPPVEDKVYEARLMYSDKCFTYVHPETKRVMPGVIDFDKFTEQIFRSCIPARLVDQRAMFVYLDINGSQVAELSTENWVIKSGAKTIVNTYPVHIVKDGFVHYGTLSFMHKY